MEGERSGGSMSLVGLATLYNIRTLRCDAGRYVREMADGHGCGRTAVLMK